MNTETAVMLYLTAQLRKIADEVPAARSRAELALIEAQTLACNEGKTLGDVNSTSPSSIGTAKTRYLKSPPVRLR